MSARCMVTSLNAEASVPDCGVSKIDLFFAEDHIDEMRYWQGDHQTIVRFSVFDVRPKFPPGKFDERKYIEKRGKSYLPSADYKDYKFVENEL